MYHVPLQDGNPPLDPSEHFMAEEEKLTDQERSKRWVVEQHTYIIITLKKNDEGVFREGKKKSKGTVVFFPDLKKPTHILYITWHKCTSTWT